MLAVLGIVSGPIPAPASVFDGCFEVVYVLAQCHANKSGNRNVVFGGQALKGGFQFAVKTQMESLVASFSHSEIQAI